MNTIGFENQLIKDIRKQQRKNTDKSLFMVENLGILEKYLSSSNKANFSLEYLLICNEICNHTMPRRYLKDLSGIHKLYMKYQQKHISPLQKRNVQVGYMQCFQVVNMT